MTDRRTIIARSVPAIRRRPFDDAPRIDTASALEPLDAARSRFIRVECFLWSHGRTPLAGYAWPGDRARAIDEIEAMLLAHRNEWTLPELEGVRDVVFVRGFVRSLTVPQGVLLARAPAILAFEPIVALRIVDVTDELSAFLGGAAMRDLYELDLSDSPFDARHARALADNPAAANVRVLRVARTRFDRAACEAICGSRVLSRVAYLDAKGSPFDPVVHGDSTHAGYGNPDEVSDDARALIARFGYRPWMMEEGDVLAEEVMAREADAGG